MEDMEGIVLKESPYGESSKILQVMTKEHGIIGVMAKGARSLKSNLRSVTGKLTYGIFHLRYKEGKLSTLTGVDVECCFKHILTDIHKISYASFLLELAEQVMKHTQKKEVYDLLLSGLFKIDEGFDPMVITNILELKYLDFLGVMPILDGCSQCGNKENIATLSSFRGGYLCKDCLKQETLVDVKTIKLIRMFYYVDLSKVSKIEVSAKVKNEINHFLDDYYDRYTGLYLKSKQFLQEIVDWSR